MKEKYLEVIKLGKKGKILVVDDTPVVRKMIKSIFENEGWQVFEARDGISAFSMYKKVSPDLVTMDISMIEGDGITATQKIVEFDSNAKIIMISASSERSLVIKSVQAGAKGFLVKPIDPHKLLKIADEVLNGK